MAGEEQGEQQTIGSVGQTIVLPGGSGYLGNVLARHFASMGYSVVVLSRRLPTDENRLQQPRGVSYRQWDGETLGDWAETFEGASAIINLAGRTVNCRYNEKNRREIYESRLRSTRVVGEAIARAARPPRVWLNSSSATIYRHAMDRPMDELTGEIGTGFSVDVCLKWEAEQEAALTPRTRKTALRSAMVFGPGKDGVMEAFLRIVRLGLGGTMGGGRQFVSWIHAEDYARAIQWIMEHDELSGPVNISSPFPVPNAEFMRTLRQVCHQPIGLPATRWMLEMGAFALGTETELLLKSRRVVPGRLLASGFVFQYPTEYVAMNQIVNG